MIVKSKHKGKSGLSRAPRVMLTFLAGGFTLISAYNGFTFYKVLFGMSMAILISVTFEVGRFACLFSFARAGKKIGMLGVLTYIVVAGVCAFAAINSFTFEVILGERAGRDQYRDQVHRIKQAYTRSVAEKITHVAKEITHVEKILSSYPKSATWKRRLATVVAKRDRLVADRDKFLNQEPENMEQWIKANSALLGLKLERKSRKSEEMISVTKALEELWGLDKGAAKKIMAIVVTATVELSIILLFFLAGVVDKPQKADEEAGMANVANVVEEPRDMAGKKEESCRVAEKEESATDTENKKIATFNVDEEVLEKFVAEYKEHFDSAGKLPPLRILSRKQRKVRKVLETLNHDDLEKLFNN